MKINLSRILLALFICSLVATMPSCKSSKKNKSANDNFGSYSGKKNSAVAQPNEPQETAPPSENTITPPTKTTLSQADINRRMGELMDALANDLKQFVKDVEVVRIKDGVQVTFDPGVYFSFDSADLTPKAKENITNLTEVLSKYAYTKMFVEGHTDNYGSRKRNLELSEERAVNFANFAKERGMDVKRVTTKGYGPDKPRYSNATLESRKKNRRIDAVITASEEMMRKIANGEL